MQPFFQHRSSTKSHLHYSSIKILLIRNMFEHRVCNTSVEAFIKYLANENLLQTQILQYNCIQLHGLQCAKTELNVPFWCNYIPWRNGTLDNSLLSWTKEFLLSEIYLQQLFFPYLSFKLIFPFPWKTAFNFQKKLFSKTLLLKKNKHFWKSGIF